MKETWLTLRGAVAAGIFIGLAGTVFLSVPDKFAGAFLFGFGLLTIVCCGFKLYTGAVGYLVLQKRSGVPACLRTLAIIWLGNFIGTNLVGLALRASRVGGALALRADGLCRIKMQDSWSSLLVLSFCCGVLMFLAVDTFRRKEEYPGAIRMGMVFLCVMVFILSGFEHCIADMFYFSAAGAWNADSLKTILIITAGNSLGGFLLPAAELVRHDA
ncbi:MAG: formate/nitrite transporter family protein [Lentisphaeria bacterium]|nr:formate/nitrite transporter family protein [Lentisphaeria bacterium]